MNKLISFVALLVLLGCSTTGSHHNNSPEKSAKTIDAILYSAEDFFICFNKSDYKTVWELLSEKSKNKIIDEIYDASRDNGSKIEKDAIRRSFRQKGLIASNFWNAARSKFNPDMVLEESHWEIGFIKNNKAEIIITYKKSPRPSKLKMYKESGSWRVGLVETFWSRKYLDSFFSFLRL